MTRLAAPLLTVALLAAPAAARPPTVTEEENVRQCESTDTATALSPNGLYKGLYQFWQPTWDAVADRAGRPDLVGVDPRNASRADQLAMFVAHWDERGPQPWPVCGWAAYEGTNPPGPFIPLNAPGTQRAAPDSPGPPECAPIPQETSFTVDIGATGLQPVILTAVDTAADGHVTVWDGGPRPLRTDLSANQGLTLTNTTLVDTADGTLNVYVHAATHILVDGPTTRVYDSRTACQ